MSSRALACAVLLALGGLPDPARGDDLFRVLTIPGEGRVVAAEIVDADGDGRSDLVVAAFTGLPPDEVRTLRVHLQDARGGLPDEPSHTIPIPRWSAVYDLADLRDTPGVEMLLLCPDRVTLLSLADGSGKHWDLPVPGPTTMGAAEDERGLERFQLAFDDFGLEPWILVPQMGELTALSPGGEVRARIAAGRRANYLVIPQSGLLSVESDLQVFLDFPKLGVGDVDGDGQTDIVTTTRHEIRTFLRRKDGSFAMEPDRREALGLVTPRDHIRASGGVSSNVRDLDGDGRLDLMVSHVEGSVTDATTTVYTYLNHGTGWDLSKPDSSITAESALATSVVIDLDGDGRMDLLKLQIKISVLEIVELLLTREIDTQVSFHRLSPEGGFEQDPWLERKISVSVDFDTFRSRGFIPTIGADLNGDGYADFLSSGDGETLEVFLGGGKKPFQKRSATQAIDTHGVIHFDDFDGDGLPDFVLFDPHHFDTKVRVGVNLGQLPGTRSSIRAAE